MQLCTSLALLISLSACGGGDSQSADASVSIDAAASAVRTVACPPGVVPTITTSDSSDMYTPSTLSISRGGIIKFIMSPSHNVAPNPIRPSDPGVKVNFGATACLEFDQTGSFGFICTVHSFAGTVTVQ